MTITGTEATATEDMEVDITVSLEERSGTGTEGAVQSAGGQTAHGVKRTTIEGVCHQDTAAGNALHCSLLIFFLVPFILQVAPNSKW